MYYQEALSNMTENEILLACSPQDLMFPLPFCEPSRKLQYVNKEVFINTS